MSHAILAFALIFGSEPPGTSLLPTFDTLAQGDGSFYAKTVMEATLAYNIGRGKLQPCARCVGYVATMNAADMGRLVYLQWSNGLIDGPYLVADAAQAEHRAGLIARHRVVEYDFHTAQAHAKLGALAGPIPVRVLWLPPEPACRAPNKEPAPC